MIGEEFRPHRAIVAGRAAQYWTIGAPKRGTAVLLHGVPTSGRLWRETALRLAQMGWQIVAPDLPGYGATAPFATDDWSLDAHLGWMTALGDQCGWPDWSTLHLAGQDYGGLLAAGAADRLGARSLALTSSAVGLGWAMATVTALPPLDRFFYRRFGGRLYLNRGVTPAARDALLRDHADQLDDPQLVGRMRQTARCMRLWEQRRLARRLRAIAIPTRCIWGTHDPFFPWPTALLTARALGADRTVLIPGGRHYLPADRPTETADALHQHWSDASKGAVGPPANA